jgi:hypothetical protein
MLKSLRNGQGEPALRVRVLAALVALGLLAVAAPAAVSIAQWILALFS